MINPAQPAQIGAHRLGSGRRDRSSRADRRRTRRLPGAQGRRDHGQLHTPLGALVRLVLCAGLVATALVGPFDTRPASAACQACGVGTDQSAAAYRGSLLLPAGTDPGLTATAARCYGCSWLVVPKCGGSPTADLICFGAVHQCAPGSIRMQLFLIRPGWSQYRPVGAFCLGAGQLLTPVGLTPGVRDRFVRYLPVLGPTFEPPGRAIVNLPVVFAAGQPQSMGLKVFLLGGHRIELDATARWHWDFGDGGFQDSTSPGGAYPDLSVSHAYTQRQTADVTVTATWAGQFWVDGAGPFEVTGPPVTQTMTIAVPVKEARAILVE